MLCLALAFVVALLWLAYALCVVSAWADGEDRG